MQVARKDTFFFFSIIIAAIQHWFSLSNSRWFQNFCVSSLVCTALQKVYAKPFGLWTFSSPRSVVFVEQKNNMMVFFDEFHTILCWVSQTLCISHFRYEIPWIIWCATVEQKKCNESQRKNSCCMTARHAFVSLVFFFASSSLFIAWCTKQ